MDEKNALNPKMNYDENARIPIVGLGASAGGLEAFEQFFRQVTPHSGMAYVLVSHLDPSHASMMTEILQRVAAIPVIEADDGMLAEHDRAYIIPPNKNLAIVHGILRLSDPEAPRGQRMPIDFFFRSLAEDLAEKSICVILSGTGTDGTLGARAVHGAGGVSFVQEPSSARYDGMPNSAIQSGFASYVMPVEMMPEAIINYAKTLPIGKEHEPAIQGTNGSITKILTAIRSATGHDFSLYKRSTILRRIERRMIAHNIDNTDNYSQYLKGHPDEVLLLFKELLINVTSFFRDAEAFAVLKTEILPKLFENKSEDYTIRIWVPGCASGEEAYSIAILFKEYLAEYKKNFLVQIYGTDIDEDSIQAARAGIYLPNITADVSPERLSRFFIKDEAGYRIRKEIREMVVFAPQNVIRDPPFSKLDLISCRNLLIYLEPEVQNRILQIFHFSLKPGGILFLSPSESVGDNLDLFGSVNKKWKLFAAKASPVRTVIAGGITWSDNRFDREADAAKIIPKETNYSEMTRRALIESFAPPSVVTDGAGNILYVHGDTGKYLRPAPGQASLNILEMAREGLQSNLRMAINEVAAMKKSSVSNLRSVKTNGGRQSVNVKVRLLTDPGAAQRLLIISFQDAEETTAKEVLARKRRPVALEKTKRVDELEQELLYTRENLQATIEEMQASNEELKSMNEELQSVNEELQSTNEEIETSKEELQSVNEELITVNSELESKIEQLSDMQNDMKNLLDSTDIGTIFLDRNLILKRFTRKATRVFRLVATDVGRPIFDIKSGIMDWDLVADARSVLDSLIPWENEIQTEGNQWFLVRITPYRTFDNVIDGVVLTFTDITKIKLVEECAQNARELAENIVDTVRDALVALDGDFKIISASRSFYEIFRLSPHDVLGRNLFEVGNGLWDIPKLRELLGTILWQNSTFENILLEHDFPIIGHKRMALSARGVFGKDDKIMHILLVMEDLSDRQLPDEQ
jgi:two-component system, chemotaxis family, CheB/CheR fusion protein